MRSPCWDHRHTSLTHSKLLYIDRTQFQCVKSTRSAPGRWIGRCEEDVFTEIEGDPDDVCSIKPGHHLSRARRIGEPVEERGKRSTAVFCIVKGVQHLQAACLVRACMFKLRTLSTVSATL